MLSPYGRVDKLGTYGVLIMLARLVCLKVKVDFPVDSEVVLTGCKEHSPTADDIELAHQHVSSFTRHEVGDSRAAGTIIDRRNSIS